MAHLQDSWTSVLRKNAKAQASGKAPEGAASDQAPEPGQAEASDPRPNDPDSAREAPPEPSGVPDPLSSLKREPDGRPAESPPRRSRARTKDEIPSSEFDRGPSLSKGGGRLWSPSRAPSSPPRSQRHGAQNTQQGSSQRSFLGREEPLEMLKQPDTRPISHAQLVEEVKGIYAGLVMVESKCIEVDNAQSAQQNDPEHKLSNEQWQALIALHRTLLHEHHDFFLASQHPSATLALRRLASKYAMPARLWRSGIHSFLELLRHRLPDSLEHMLTFICLAYSMMALLYETVPAFEDTWIECLGDLGRYRMAIEEVDLRERDTWTAVSRLWYSKASDRAPTTGRLYHHLAILARPNALQQLFYYVKSLCVPIPFPSARESVMTLFDPVLLQDSRQSSRLSPVDAAYTRAHAILFSGKSWDRLESTVDEYASLLDAHIARSSKKWLEHGYYIGIAGFCALQEYGKTGNVINKVLCPVKQEETADLPMEEGVPENGSPFLSKEFVAALSLTRRTHEIVLRRFGDNNILSYLHVSLVFMYHMAQYPAVFTHLDQSFPWKLASLMLNTLVPPLTASGASFSRIEASDFPGGSESLTGKGSDKNTAKNAANRPLPEDFAMRGMAWGDDYLPPEWFSNLKIDDDEKFFEVASMTQERKERILWLGHKISLHKRWLTYDAVTHRFGVTRAFDVEDEALPGPGPELMEPEEDMMSATDAEWQSLPASETPSFVEGFEDSKEDSENVPAASSSPTVPP